jgi:OST-HTH/LOTUS domain-containing protein
VGVKKSTSDLLVAACDEFIYYDDLVREEKPRRRKPQAAPAPAASTSPKRKTPANAASYTATAEATAADSKVQEALELIMATVEALVDERGDDEPVWGSMVKQTLKRRKPGFNERYYGFSSFNELLEEARARGQLELERDAKSGGYIVRPTG